MTAPPDMTDTMTTAPPAPTTPEASSVPLAVKLGFTAFMAVLVPYYWANYGVTNFVYFCDIALFLTLWSVWTERPLAASMAAVGILLPQLAWQVDFLLNAVNLPGLGMTDYMFDAARPLFVRGLSFFHFWLPILLVYLVHRLGYDRRALAGWTLIAWAAMLVGYFLLPGPGDPYDFPMQPHNVNYVYGPSETAAQVWMPAPAWLAVMMIGLPVLVYGPTHLLLNRWRGLPRRGITNTP